MAVFCAYNNWCSLDEIGRMYRPERMLEPPETDLEYYARPENYMGSSLDSLTRFLVARSREDTKEKNVCKTEKRSDEQEDLLRRYRHILPATMWRSFPSSASSSFSGDEQVTNMSHASRTVERWGMTRTRKRERRVDAMEWDVQEQRDLATRPHNPDMVELATSPHNPDMDDLATSPHNPDMDELATSPHNPDMDDLATSPHNPDMDDLAASPHNPDMDELATSPHNPDMDELATRPHNLDMVEQLNHHVTVSDDNRTESGYTRRQGRDQQEQKSTFSDGISDKCALGQGERGISHIDTAGNSALTTRDPGSDLHRTSEVDSTGSHIRPDVIGRVSMLSSARFSAPPIRRRRPGTVRLTSTRPTTTNTTTTTAPNMSGEARHRSYLHKLKRVATAVVNVLKLAKVIIKRTDSPSALLKTFTSMSREPETDDLSENMKNYGLHFDPSYFRANKEISISSEVKSILRLPPSHRSSEQIQTAMFGLQSLPSFAEYPLHMQEKLTRVAWYEIVTPMRTIIRQGHFAENFYFILAGQAVVTIHKPGETGTQTAAIMRKGTSFGELALLHHSRRTATVISHDTVQLLSVGRDDFFVIFMSGHGLDEIPDHIRFVSQMDFMKDWPLERLLERPDQCLLHFFKRNMVIVKDSKISDWLYVVKSGSCQVLKQLKAVSGSLGMPRRLPLTDEVKLEKHVTGAWHQDLTPGTGMSLRKKKRARADTERHTPEPQAPGVKIRPDLSGDHTKESHPSQKDQGQGQRSQLPVFVQIELLKPRDVFGLDLVNFNLDSNPPSVSLVSLGAECIMLSKSFFLKHANQQTKKRFSERVQPYPNEETLQDSLQTKVNWELYKRSLIAKVMAHKRLF